MPRNRTIPADFWTWETVIDCAPMTRLLFLGLWTFADDFGVQPLRPRTIRMQVFPGDIVDGDAVRAMVEELAARGLVRRYSVDGQDYIAIVDWDRMQQVGRRARRRFPDISETDQGPTRSTPTAGMITDHSNRPLASRAEDIANHNDAPSTVQVEGTANHSNAPPTSRAESTGHHNNPSFTCREEDSQVVGAMHVPPLAAAFAAFPRSACWSS